MKIQIALKLKKRIFPIWLAGDPFPHLMEYQYVDVTDGQMPPERFYDTLKTMVGHTFSADIKTFGETWMHHFGYEPQSKNDILETNLCSLVGLKVTVLDVKFIAVVKADGMSLSEIYELHNAFHRTIAQWRPAHFTQRYLKKHGAIGFIFEQGQPTGIATRVDSEAKRLMIRDSVRTEMWYVDFTTQTITTDERLGILPVISPYNSERRQMEALLKQHFEGENST